MARTHPLVSNNLIRQYFDRGIVTEAGEGAADFNVTITNNTVSNFADAINSLHGIHGDFGILAGDTNDVCVDIQDNLVATAGNEPAGGFDIRLRKGTGPTVRIPGLVGGTATDADNLITAENPNATTVTVTNPGATAFGRRCRVPVPDPPAALIGDRELPWQTRALTLLLLLVGTEGPTEAQEEGRSPVPPNVPREIR